MRITLAYGHLTANNLRKFLFIYKIGQEIFNSGFLSLIKIVYSNAGNICSYFKLLKLCIQIKYNFFDYYLIP